MDDLDTKLTRGPKTDLVTDVILKPSPMLSTATEERFGRIGCPAVCQLCGEPRSRIFWWDRGEGRTHIDQKCDACGGLLDSSEWGPVDS